MILKQEKDNTVTFVYKKADLVIYRENSSDQDEGGNPSGDGSIPDDVDRLIPDTGDRIKIYGFLLAAVLGLAVGVAAVKSHTFRA